MGRRSLVGMMLVGLISACSSSTGSSSGTPGGSSGAPTKADCTNIADLCVVLTVAELNSACKASFTAPLNKTEPFVSGAPELGFVGHQCDYVADPRSAVDASVNLKRYCYGGGAAEAQRTIQSDLRTAGQSSEPISTEVVSGIGAEAHYTYHDADLAEGQSLVSREGNVLFGAEIGGAIGSRDAVKACLAAVVKKMMAATPAK